MQLASLEDNKAIADATKAIADIRKLQYPEIYKYESEVNSEEVEFDREDAAKVYENQIINDSYYSTYDRNSNSNLHTLTPCYEVTVSSFEISNT